MKSNRMNGCLLLLASVLILSSSVNAQTGGTHPDQLKLLIAFRDAMLARGGNWTNALKTWTCPTDPSNSVGSDCDPCGKEAWGNWDHMACRGHPVSATKWEVPGDGVVTNIHVTDLHVEGKVPTDEMCKMKHLREFDFDGGDLTGSIPTNFAECFPDLGEIDLSYNQLTGELPKEIANNKNLLEFKVENNRLEGSIPEEYAMPNMAWFRFAENRFSGKIPESFSRTAPRLNQLTLDNNDFSGNLYPLAKHHMTSFKAHQNPKLCGMVPVGLRFAHGFNYYQTGLGLPCPEEIAAAKGASG